MVEAQRPSVYFIVRVRFINIIILFYLHVLYSFKKILSSLSCQNRQLHVQLTCRKRILLFFFFLNK